jgi:conjugal transfer pilus assembly protein TraE
MLERLYNSRLVSAMMGFWGAMTIAILLAFSNAYLVYFINHMETRESFTVLPSNIEKPFKLQGGKYSANYIEQVSTWLTMLSFNYTSDTFQYQANTVLKYVSPEKKQELKLQFSKDAKYLERQKIVSTFFIHGVEIQGNKAYISGLLRTELGKKEKKEREILWLVELKTLKNGLFQIVEFKEIKDE